jgi:hypothetical protein
LNKNSKLRSTYKCGSRRHVPRSNVSIEGILTIEDIAKIGDLAHIPVCNVETVEKVSIEKKMSICQCVSFCRLANSRRFTYPWYTSPI